MTQSNFIFLLQQILTVTDKDNTYSVAFGKSVLESVISMAEASDKCSQQTKKVMTMALGCFDFLAQHADEYAFVQGEDEENAKKFQLLDNAVDPQ